MKINILNSKIPSQKSILELYQANKWSAVQKPEKLYLALSNSHHLVTAWDADRLIGLGNSISDGHLLVYYPHLLIHPDYQGNGIGKLIMNEMQKKYANFHMQMLTADEHAFEFYQKIGFERAGNTIPMWIYDGEEH